MRRLQKRAAPRRKLSLLRLCCSGAMPTMDGPSAVALGTSESQHTLRRQAVALLTAVALYTAALGAYAYATVPEPWDSGHLVVDLDLSTAAAPVRAEGAFDVCDLV